MAQKRSHHQHNHNGLVVAPQLVALGAATVLTILVLSFSAPARLRVSAWLAPKDVRIETTAGIVLAAYTNQTAQGQLNAGTNNEEPAQISLANLKMSVNPVVAKTLAFFGTETGRSTQPDAQVVQQTLSNWISRKYKVSNEAVEGLVAAAFQYGNELHVDPLLILAVIATESSFNPFAESHVGAQGLMQVMTKLHQDKFSRLSDKNSSKSALNPAANIRVGTLILKEYIARAGSVEGALKLYVGAASFSHDGGYGARVLAERTRLYEALEAKLITTLLPANLSNKPELTQQGAAQRNGATAIEAPARTTIGQDNKPTENVAEIEKVARL